MKELVLKEIENIKEGIFDERIKEFINHGNKYAILKDSVTVTVRLTTGIEAVIDVTDLVL